MAYDGLRIGCRIRDRSATLIGTDGKIWTTVFPEIQKAAVDLGVRDSFLDGEVAVVLPDGRTSSQALQAAIAGGPRRGLVFFVFDLLRLEGTNVRRQPLESRKRELLKIVGRPGPRTRIRYSEHVLGGGARVFEAACRLGVPGVVSKRRDAPYTSGQTRTWLKTTCNPAAVKARPTKPRVARAHAARATVAGISISHPDRVIYPGTNITKLTLAQFYERIADWILPHLRGRPLTLVRCPEGLPNPCFYMKHSSVWKWPQVRRVRIQERTKIGEYLVVDSLPALISLIQMNVLELHTWNTCVDHLEQPDRIVFDIDPGAKIQWSLVVEAGRFVRRLLREVDLESFPKTTGGRGLHVVVPLTPAADWRVCLEFSRAVALAMERHNPRLYTTTFAKAGRERKILIDYLRNNRTNTSVAAYSTRAREGATIAVPLSWNELSEALDPRAFTVLTIDARLKRKKDPWAAYWKTKQHLTAAARAYAESSTLVG